MVMLLEQQCLTCGQGLKIPLPKGQCPICLGIEFRFLKKCRLEKEEINRETVFLGIKEVLFN